MAISSLATQNLICMYGHIIINTRVKVYIKTHAQTRAHILDVRRGKGTISKVDSRAKYNKKCHNHRSGMSMLCFRVMSVENISYFSVPNTRRKFREHKLWDKINNSICCFTVIYKEFYSCIISCLQENSWKLTKIGVGKHNLSGFIYIIFVELIINKAKCQVKFVETLFMR